MSLKADLLGGTAMDFPWLLEAISRQRTAMEYLIDATVMMSMYPPEPPEPFIIEPVFNSPFKDLGRLYVRSWPGDHHPITKLFHVVDPSMC